MLKNYLVTAYRNILRYKLDSFLNISGLVIGFSAALLISLFIEHEHSYDTFWKDADRLYRIQTRWIVENRDDIDIVNSAGPLKAALENYFPNELDTVARLHFRKTILYTETELFRDVITYADPEILDIFNFNIISGDARAALAGKSSIILNKSLAQKYFGDVDPVGKVITLDNQYLKKDYKVAAVMSDLPENSHLDIQAIIQINEQDYVDNNGAWMFSSWHSANNHTYFKLTTGNNIEQINSQIDAFTDKSIPDTNNKASDYTKYTMMPVSDIHLHSKSAGSVRKPGGDSTIVFAFGIISLLIVIVATINYINLSTARAGQRSREVAMRKVLGAKRKHLIIQYLGESMLIVSFAIFITLAIVEICIPYFNQMLNVELVLDVSEPDTLLVLLTTLLMVSGLSGLYPALILSSYLPSQSLRSNRSSNTDKTVKARNILVIFQTVITVSLIVATIVVYAQLTYFRMLDRGFEPEQMLVIEGISSNEEVKIKRDSFKDRIVNLPNIINATFSYEAPTRYSENNTRLRIPGESDEQSYPLGATSVDAGYIDSLKIPLLAGRFYEKNRARDKVPETDNTKKGDVLEGNLVINKLAAEKLGFGIPENAIGRKVHERYSTDDGMRIVEYTIIGVIANSNLHSLKRPFRPEIYSYETSYNYLLIRYAGNANEILTQVKNIWSEMMSNTPFEYFYVDEALDNEFQFETKQANVFLGFAILTMVIGCLGLYGLAAFVVETRKKEIGIRKILGAKVKDVLALLLGQFSRLVFIANIIAWPIIYYLMNDWLQQYPFRLDNFWILIFCVISGVLSIAIVTATVGSQVLRIAIDNPINAIRQE